MAAHTQNRLLPVIIIFLIILLFFYKLAFTDFILARGDTFAYFYPYWDARDAALMAGELPLWMPDLFMGAPLLANPQVGALYPPNWLTAPLPAPDAIKISIMLHVGWAVLGAYLLARRALNLSLLSALLAGIVFGFSGYIGAHVEQINQLQGLSWLPWLFLLFHNVLSTRGQTRMRRLLPWLALMGAAWAMQLLSGHTQTVFITGVGLVIYGVFASMMPVDETNNKTGDIGTSQRIRPVIVRIISAFALLAVAALMAVILAAPQLIPTQELVSLSNRGGGLNQHEATAFSLNPFLIGRGLLPSYDAQPFSEYVGYVGIIALGLAVYGGFTPGRLRWVWLLLVAVGLVFALGRHTPIYWTLADLPGFNLFRVPARWLALYTLGLSMLAGSGLARLGRPRAAAPAIITVGIVAVLAGLSLLSDRAAAEVDGSALPTLATWIGWGVALAMLMIAFWWLRHMSPKLGDSVRFAVALGVVVELWFAAQFLPYNDVTDPAVYKDTRFAINQMRVYAEDDTPPGRMLSISGLLFDPGDRAALQARWADLPISDRAARYAFTATKMQETLAANLPLTWGVPTVDGFGGGVLPTLYYTQFTSLLLPEGTPRTIDGRLREVLAQPACRGACIPEDRWLDLMNVRYLLTDKVYDLWHEDIAYDTQFSAPLAAGAALTIENTADFEADALHILYTCTDCDAPGVQFDNTALSQVSESSPTVLDGLTLARYTLDAATIPDTLTITAPDDVTIHALTLVDRRTGDFVQLTPPGWARVYSADIKIYENLAVLPRAFVVHNAIILPDSYAGSEQALDIMRDPAFDPAQTVVIHGDGLQTFDTDPATASTATITHYSATQIDIQVEAVASGYLILTDAYHPGWESTENYPIYRANVMFRAIPVAAGSHTIRLMFDPF